MTIGKKLLLATSAMVAATLLLAAASLFSIQSLSALLLDSADRQAKKTEVVFTMRVHGMSLRAAQRGVVGFAALKEHKRLEAARKQFQDTIEKMTQLTGELERTVQTDAGRRSLADIRSAVAEWRASYATIDRLAEEGRFDGALTQAMDEAAKDADAFDRAADGILQLQRNILAANLAKADQTGSVSLWLVVVIALLSLAAGVGAVLVVRWVNRTLRLMAEQLAEGAEQTASASMQVSSSSQSLAQGASEQAASLEETSASAHEITSMAKKNAENSQSAVSMLEKWKTLFEQSNQLLNEMQVAMRRIGESSEKVGRVIKVIDEIAFQTNILALNAAVEAARAGESGLGFAVVADEVRNLAQRSAQAAKETASLIEESTANAKQGHDKLEEVAGGIRALSEEAARVRELSDEVRSASAEQATGLDQIARAVAQMEQVTQSSAANAEESAAASEELNSQTESTRALVLRLKRMVDGADSGETETRAPERAFRAAHAGEPVNASRGR